MEWIIVILVVLYIFRDKTDYSQYNDKDDL